jgi:hypothetical protein
MCRMRERGAVQHANLLNLHSPRTLRDGCQTVYPIRYIDMFWVDCRCGRKCAELCHNEHNVVIVDETVLTGIHVGIDDFQKPAQKHNLGGRTTTVQ